MKKALKIFKWTALLLVFLCSLPFLVRSAYYVVMEQAMYMAVNYFWDDHATGVRLVSKYGDKYAAYKMIAFLRDKPVTIYPDNHDRAVIVLAKRFPDEADQYMAFLVSSILDSKTSIDNNFFLLRTLEMWTGERFGFYTDEIYRFEPTLVNAEQERMNAARANVLKWWKARLDDQLHRAVSQSNKKNPLKHKP